MGTFVKVNQRDKIPVDGRITEEELPWMRSMITGRATASKK